MSPSISLTVGSVLALYAAWRLTRKAFDHSPLDNIAGPPSGSFFTGNMGQLFDYDNWDYMRRLLDTYGSVCRLHFFIGHGNCLLVNDPKAIHAIYVKDQDIFTRDDRTCEGLNLLIGPGLLSATGDIHRRQRKMLNPVFSAAYMRGITPFFYEVVAKLETAIALRVQAGTQDVDMIGWMGRAALELVGQGALGYSFDPLVADSKDAFTEAVKSFVPSITAAQHGIVILPLIKYLGPAWFRRILVDIWPDRSIQQVKRLVDTVDRRTREIFDEKRAAIERGDGAMLGQIAEGKDVMSILLRANMSASEEDKLPDKELLAQMATFIVAGVDTTSNAMSRVLDLLAQYPDAQDRLRAEILEAREQYGKEIPYDELMQLPYLDAVCRETLRMFAPAGFTTREAVKDTVLPLLQPVRGLDGTSISELPVPKGTAVFTYVTAPNTDKSLWGEDALEWKPERWLKPLPREVEEARIPGIYAHQWTFSGGGYACIGFKFSQLEMKIVLSALLAVFRFAPCPERPFVWNSAGVAFPAAKTGNMNPEMYLKVSRVGSD